MPGSNRYRIGEFARLAGVSIKTLRFYDEQGLLAPIDVDPRTRYRGYSPEQLRDLAVIRALKELGASLADIRRVVRRSTDDRERRRLLEKLRRGARHTLESAQRSLRCLDLALEELSPDEPAVAISLKHRAGIRVASIRARLGNYGAIGELERDLRHAVAPQFARGVRGVLWHRCEASGVIEGEPFIEIGAGLPRSSRFEVKALPSANLACAFCEPDDAAAARVYEAIDRWVHARDYRIAGPKRELYVGNLLEVQFPLAAE
jgi:DNA-binding transcriptional MerR regulator